MFTWISNLFRTWFGKEKLDHELDAEVRAYVEMAMEEKMATGMNEEQARRAAVIEAGGLEQIKERTREVRMGTLIETIWQDIRYALRMLRKNPGFTTVAVLTLALGIGANSAIFSWINRILLDPIPGVENSGELVELLITFKKDGRSGSVSYPNYESYRDRNTTLEGFVAHTVSPFSMVFEGKAERVWGSMVSANFFDLLDVRPVLGRTFLKEEGIVPGRDPVVVVSHALWQRSLGGDPLVLGKQVTLNSYPFTIIGVTPQEFRGADVGMSLDAWIPVVMEPQIAPNDSALRDRGDGWLSVKGKLKPGVSLAQARFELNEIADQLALEFPDTNKDRGAGLVRIWRAPGAQSFLAPVLFLLQGVVGFVLLLACANVANLLLARATARRREIAIRLSLGAGRKRLVRQLLTESFLLALLGGTAGLLVAYWSSGLLNALIPDVSLPINLEAQIDGQVLLFTLGVATIAGMIFGLLPAWQSSRSDLVSSLNDESGRSTGSRRGNTLRNILAVAQVSLSIVLLISAALFVRSLKAAETINPGFRTTNILLASVDLVADGYSRERGHQFIRQIREELTTVPGVESVALGRYVPIALSGRSDSNIEVEGYQPGPNERLNAYHTDVTPGYFKTMGIPLLGGRDFSSLDNDDASKVVIINRSLADRYWKDGNALGGRIRRREAEYTVVGIVRDFKYIQLTEDPVSILFFPLYQRPGLALTIHLQTKGRAAEMTPTLRETVRSLDPNLALFGVTTMEELLVNGAVQQKIAGSLLGVFGLLALALATIGIYGVLAFLVSQRTHEIGIRMALGAQKGEIFRTVLVQGAKLVGTGLAIGLVAAVAFAQLFASLLFGISPSDPVTFVGASLGMIIAALMACYIPARRATRVDPMTALRYE